MSWEEPRQEVFRQLDMLELEADQAYLNVTTGDWDGAGAAYLYYRNKNCYGCPYELVQQVKKQNKTKHAIVMDNTLDVFDSETGLKQS